MGSTDFNRYNDEDVDESICDPTIVGLILLCGYDNKKVCSLLLTFTLDFEFCCRCFDVFSEQKKLKQIGCKS